MTLIVIVCVLVTAVCGAWVVGQASARAAAAEEALVRMADALAAAEEGLRLLADTGDAHAQALAASTLRRIRSSREPGGLGGTGSQ
jgi:hypothetical protein